MKDLLSLSPGRIIELTNGKFVDVINGSFFGAESRVYIRNGKIFSIRGVSGSDTVINPDIAIDLKGRTVIPGLFNTHCHIQMINPTLLLNCKTRKARKKFHSLQVDKNMEECFFRGITNIRDAYTEDLRPNRKLAMRIRTGELKGPRIQQAVVVGALGGYLSPDLRGLNKKVVGLLGQGNLDFDDCNSGVIGFPPGSSEGVIRDKVDKAIEERGADLIKVGESLEKSMINSNPSVMETGQLSAICDQAGKRGLQSSIHSVSLETFRRAVSAGFSSIAHVPRDGRLLSGDVEKCKNAGCIVDPTLSVGYDMSWRLKGDPFYNDPITEKLSSFRKRVYAGLADEFWIPELRDLVKAGFEKANESKYNMFGIIDLSKLLAHFSALPAYGFENAKMLFDHGVSLSCGNDGGIQSCTPAMIGHEMALLELAVKLNNAEALRTATIHSAKSMGLEDEFGSIEVGKTADLAILDGDPFEDFSLVGKPVDALFMDGKLVLDKMGLAG